MAGGAEWPRATPFVLRVFGAFELAERATGRLVTIKSLKMRALLAVIAATPGQRANRRRMAGLLWASLGEAPALHNLRQTLSNFRKACPDADILLTDDESLALNASVLSSDHELLHKARQSADVECLRRAASAYRGEFGAGLEVGEEEIDRWLADEQARCRDAAVSIHDRLVRLLAGAGLHREALDHANRLAEIDPYREETHRLVIAAEEAVSGRGSALARFQQFAELLRTELDVAPEQATRDLIDGLRARVTTRAVVPPPEAPTAEAPHPAPERVVPRDGRAGRRRIAAAATLAAAVLGGSLLAWQASRAPVVYAGEDSGRVSIAILPFQPASEQDGSGARMAGLDADTRIAFSRAIGLAAVEIRDGVATRDPVSTGRALGARYVVKTAFSRTSRGAQADVALFDTASGVSVAATAIPEDGMTTAFARTLFHFVASEVTLHRARILAATEPDSTAALLWRAEAAHLKTRVGAASPEEARLFEAALSREPDQLVGLLGLASTLILRVAREQSPDRAADIARAGDLLRRAREQAPSLAEIAFREGMLEKLQGRFESAEKNFERAFALDRIHWNAAAQAAHVKIFRGQFEDAFTGMELATAYLLPDLGAAETAYIAGETALVAGHPERAVAYLDMAIAGNATVARIHGMRAAALWMAGRHDEARAAATRSRKLEPPYAPELMMQRGRATAASRFKEARDRYVEAYRAALAPAPASIN